MNGALWFLLGRSFRNRLTRQFSRLKQPRYAVAMLFALAYFGFLGYSMTFSGRVPEGVPLPGGVPSPTDAGADGPLFPSLIGVGGAVTVILWWLFGGVSSSLAYSAADVHFLFPAPLTRRALVAYKLIRTQALLVLNAIIWMVIIRSWGVTLPPWVRFANAWAFFTLLSMHRFGAALVQLPDARGARRVALWGARALAAVAAVAILSAVAPAVSAFRAGGPRDGLTTLLAEFGTAPASYVLAPFQLVMAPLLARSLEAWLPSFTLVLGIVAAHVVWVLSMRVHFEEVAATASADLARRVSAFRKGSFAGLRARPIKARHQWLGLSPVGAAWVAITWKNTLALLRSGAMRSAALFIGILLMSLAITTSADVDGQERLAILVVPLVTIVFLTTLLGPRTFRNDLRQDLLSLSLIKTYPLRGSTIVAAEIASPALVLTAIQTLLIGVGVLLAVREFPADQAGVLLVGAALAPLVLGGINVLSFLIQNAAALAFPSWVRLGPDSGGFEAMGQTMLVGLGTFLALLISLIPPVLLAVVMVAVLQGISPVGAAAAAILAAAAMLVVEISGTVLLMGRTLERTEPGATV